MPALRGDLFDITDEDPLAFIPDESSGSDSSRAPTSAL
jgi:hypothetical protein